MTKAAALHNFWSQFGLDAYEENSVPTGSYGPTLPYITYSQSSGGFGDAVPLSGSLWYRDTAWTECNAKAEQISKAISLGGVMLPYDGGAMWITRGSPFASSMGDSSDNTIKRKIINITAEFMSAD